MDNYFYVDIEDEITTILGRLRKEKSEEIFLVVPKHALIAQSLVNLRLLEKETRRSGKKIMFVSPDAHIRKIAEKAGLSVKRYVAKPKDNIETQNFASLTGNKQPLQPWEEAAAKEELKKAIGKNNPVEKLLAPHRTGTEPAAVTNPTVIKAKVFGASTMPGACRTEGTPKKPAAIGANPQIVDLKKLIPESRRKLTNQKKIEKTEPAIKKQTEEKIEDSNLINKKTEFIEEPPLKELLSGSDDTTIETGDHIKQAIKTRAKPQIARINPFRVRKLEKSTLPPVKSVPTPHAILPKEGETKEESNLPNVIPNEFERETANLTLREKECLRDLWMRQRGVVRGKTFQTSSSLDLRSKQETEANKEKLTAEETGIFQTTHRRVAGPGKVVDLRGASTPLFTAPELVKEKKLKKKGREIILPIFNVKLFVFFFLGILVVLSVLAGIILPEAVVNVKTKVSEDQLKLTVWANGEVSQIDPKEKIIPGEPVHFKVSEEKIFLATNEKEIKENAKGRVAIYNRGDKPLSLKQNALLVDGSGKKLFTEAPITVPAAKKNDNVNSNTNADNINGNDNSSQNLVPGNTVVSVSAEGLGKEFNLKAGSSLDIPGLKDSDFSGLITAEVEEEITGGENKKVKAVSKEDLDKAKEELISKARQNSQGELEKNVGSIGGIGPENLTVEDVSFVSDKAEGEEADSFKATSEVTFFAVAFAKEDLENLAKSIIEGEREEKEGRAMLINFQVGEIRPLENKMEINSTVSYQLTSQISGSEVRKILIAKRKQEAENYLKNRKDIEQFSVEIWPNWLNHMPILERRIKVAIE